MNFTTAPLSWHWGIIFLVCLIGALSVGRTSRFYPLFWWPLITLGGICSFTFLKSCGAGPRDGPSGLVVLFAVLPVTIVSALGIFTGFICLRKPPKADGAKPLHMGSGIAISALALFLTTRYEMRSLTVRVLDGNGKPVRDVTVNAKCSDAMTRETKKQEVTGSDGVASFEFWRFQYLEVSTTAQGCGLTRATYGKTGFGGQGWTVYNEYPQYDPTTVDLHLRRVDDFVLPDVRNRLMESLASAKGEGAKYALARVGANFENFEIMDQIIANPSLRGSLDTFLSKQAELLTSCFKVLDCKLPRGKRRFFRIDPDALGSSGWNGLARWAGIPGDQVPVTTENLGIVDQHLCHLAETLLDAAKPMLGEENSTARTYSELRFIAKERVPDLTAAYRTATPRAKSMILDALGDLKPGYADLEALMLHAQPIEAIRILLCVDKFRDKDEFERARAHFREVEAGLQPIPDRAPPHNHLKLAYNDLHRFFEQQEKRLDNAPESN